MIELLIAGVSFFGGGSWSCIHQYEYPQQNVRETFISHVQYSEDLSYVASSKIVYSYLNENEGFAQFSYAEKGVAKISGNEFYLNGHAYNVTKDFDKIGHFKSGYVKEITEFLNTPMQPEEKTLTVVSKTKSEMTVKHLPSGTITQCQASSNEV